MIMEDMSLNGAMASSKNPDMQNGCEDIQIPSGRVLLASVTNLLFPVDIDLIHFLFSKYGNVEKVVSFSRTPTMYQVLVQFADPNQAKEAMRELHSRNIYDGCNTLQIQMSRLGELSVKANSVKAWDYTIDAAGPSASLRALEANGSKSNAMPQQILTMPPNVRTPNGMHPPMHSMPQMFPQRPNMRETPGVSTPDFRNSYPGRMYPTNPLHSFQRVPKEIRDMNIEFSNPSQTPVIIVYKLDTDVTVQMLFNLFSLYGVVLRIKILRGKPDTALVQYSDALYATIAQNLMTGCVVGKQAIQVAFSTKMEVRLPPVNGYPENTIIDEEEAKRTMAFTHRDQRYGSEDVEKYIKGSCRPTRTLFVASIDENVTESTLREYFSNYGTVTKFTFKTPKNEINKIKMALLEMSNETEAVSAIMHLHNFEISGRPIKVAFSKSVI